MWTLPLPTTEDVDAQLTSALTFVDGREVHRLSDIERAAIHAVYKAYDDLLGQPDPNLTPIVLAGCRQHIRDAYSQVQLGGRLASLRAALLSSTDVCPYCGFGEPTQLDHYLPKITYGELAIYPRNLIPSCGPCNNAKRATVPAGGDQAEAFIQPYFQIFPDVTFMRADVDFAGGALDVTFRIATELLTPRLGQMLEFQLARLKLSERYPRQINKFLSEQRTAILMLKEGGVGPNVLSDFLVRSATSLAENFGSNDWRAALVVALASNPEFCAAPGDYFGTRARAGVQRAEVIA